MPSDELGTGVPEAPTNWLGQEASELTRDRSRILWILWSCLGSQNLPSQNHMELGGLARPIQGPWM